MLFRSGPVGKYILADQILRKAWDIVLLEEIESLGELEVSLKHWQLSLLTAGGMALPNRRSSPLLSLIRSFRNSYTSGSNRTSTKCQNRDILAP